MLVKSVFVIFSFLTEFVNWSSSSVLNLLLTTIGQRLQQRKLEVKTELKEVTRFTDEKYKELLKAFNKQKCLSDIWYSLNYRKDNIINQEIRTLTALNGFNSRASSKVDNLSNIINSSNERSSFMLKVFEDIPLLIDMDFDEILKDFNFNNPPVSSS